MEVSIKETLSNRTKPTATLSSEAMAASNMRMILVLFVVFVMTALLQVSYTAPSTNTLTSVCCMLYKHVL
jgi:hypothetical protein